MSKPKKTTVVLPVMSYNIKNECLMPVDGTVALKRYEGRDNVEIMTAGVPDGNIVVMGVNELKAAYEFLNKIMPQKSIVDEAISNHNKLVIKNRNE